MPTRQPAYRSKRGHRDFLYPLKNELSWEALKSRLTLACVELLGATEARMPEHEKHRQATLLIS